jgi:membrane associated rhomboid family serine protease
MNRDRAPDHTPVATYGLIAVNSLVWLLLAATGDGNLAVQHFGFRPAHWTIVTLFASIFLHSGFFHVLGNMWFLSMFGPKVEERLGPLRYTLIYLLCGLGATGLYSLFATGSNVPLVGASGAISGVAGLYFVLLPRSPFELILYFGWIRIKSFRSQTRGAVGAWIGEQFVLALLNGFVRSNVAFWAHVGGFGVGAACAAWIANSASAAEQEEILHPQPLTEEEKGEIFADTVPKPNQLTSLNLSQQNSTDQ